MNWLQTLITNAEVGNRSSIPLVLCTITFVRVVSLDEAWKAWGELNMAAGDGDGAVLLHRDAVQAAVGRLDACVRNSCDAPDFGASHAQFLYHHYH